MIATFLASIAADDPLPKSPPSDDFWMPLDASTFGAEIDPLYDFLFWLSTVSLVGIVIAMAMFVIKYRAGAREKNEVGDDSSHHNTALEIIWSVIPLVICIGIFVWGFKGYVELRTPPRDTLELHATGQKWKWTFEYPNGHMDSELHIPLDRDVRIIIQSVDVLHSLYIPAFRTKMDAVPGRYTDLWFHATKAGEYPVFCAEYCGTSHSDMIAKAVVHEAGGYEKWLDGIGELLKNQAAENPVAFGEKLYNKQGCKTCHSVDGSALVGPSWKGLWSKTREFADGSSTVADENYILQSINDPSSQVVAGFTPSMPTYKGQMKDWELNALIEYIKSLK
jgi:cytochrome c oxidase subunit II